MKKQAFDFELPPELIAQYPLENRSDSRLLVYSRKTGQHQHTQFKHIVDLLVPGDLLVLNDSKVIPARLFGRKLTGGQVEFLVERILTDSTFIAHIKASKSPKPGTVLELAQGWRVEMIERQEDLFHCKLNGHVNEMLEQIGHIPLPLYVTRPDEKLDTNRYQTVYASKQGSVAAPTAGLHFDEAILKSLQEKGIEIAYLTLHVGAGTFRPVRCDNIHDHIMHKERFTLTQELCDSINNARKHGRRVVAVGTTVARSLESAAKEGQVVSQDAETDIFIYPGFRFQICDALITNFHLPQSTLLMLVSAFIGHTKAMSLYQVAIEHRYRFFSYGDVSFLT